MNYYIHIAKRVEKDLAKSLDCIEFSLKNLQAADNLHTFCGK